MWEDQVSKGAGQRSLQIGTLRDAFREEACYREGYEQKELEEQDLPPAPDVPNLSLDTGIKRRSPGWFYAVASLGCDVANRYVLNVVHALACNEMVKSYAVMALILTPGHTKRSTIWH